jgi:hypothetical protein
MRPDELSEVGTVCKAFEDGVAEGDIEVAADELAGYVAAGDLGALRPFFPERSLELDEEAQICWGEQDARQLVAVDDQLVEDRRNAGIVARIEPVFLVARECRAGRRTNPALVDYILAPLREFIGTWEDQPGLCSRSFFGCSRSPSQQ